MEDFIAEPSCPLAIQIKPTLIRSFPSPSYPIRDAKGEWQGRGRKLTAFLPSPETMRIKRILLSFSYTIERKQLDKHRATFRLRFLRHVVISISSLSTSVPTNCSPLQPSKPRQPFFPLN